MLDYKLELEYIVCRSESMYVVAGGVLGLVEVVFWYVGSPEVNSQYI